MRQVTDEQTRHDEFKKQIVAEIKANMQGGKNPRERQQTEKGKMERDCRGSKPATGIEHDDAATHASIDLGLFTRDKLIVVESGLPVTSTADKEVTIYCFIYVCIHW